MTIDFPDGLGRTIYEYDYYSGSNVLVYAEHVLIDDCVRIGWNVQQNRQPIWGYASQYFNAVASGVIMVNGSFWVAFKETAYMPAILNEVMRGRGFWESGEMYGSPGLGPGGTMGYLAAGETENPDAPGTRAPQYVQRASVERLMHAAEQDADSLEVARSLSELTTQLGAMSDTEFEDVAERFEDVVWYAGNRQENQRPEGMSGNINWTGRETDDLFSRRLDQYPPIDLLVTFGDMSTTAANHTVHRISDVTIVNTEFSGIEPTGEPILVRYDFLARNVL